MKHKTEKKHGSTARTLLAAAVMVGVITTGFYGVVQVVQAAENNQVIALPTNYSAGINAMADTDLSVAKDGYIQPSYTIVDNELFKDDSPTANDISRDEAAKIGAQAINSVFGVDLDGKTIEMGYWPAKAARAEWFGECWIEGKKGPEYPAYSFTLDAITGEVNVVQHSRILDVDTDLGYDAELAKNPAEMEAVAKQYATELNVVGGPVKSSIIDTQGYTNNDPTVNFRIEGENGKRASIELSRYDKALLYVSYEGGEANMDAFIQDVEELAEKASNNL